MRDGGSPDLSPAGLCAALAELVEEDPQTVLDSDNLFELGLDSIDLMHLVSGWRKAGVPVDFAELAQQPTVAAWAELA
ncbi:MAG: phosphopantetheine-binding protein, partial [Actinomycetota bacterium]|nr:phosphopantetheine-binding protein [Actinomycetota bacterium]